MNNVLPLDFLKFIFKFMKAWKIKPLNYFPLLRERKQPKPLILHHFKRTGSQVKVLEFSKPKLRHLFSDDGELWTGQLYTDGCMNFPVFTGKQETIK